MKYIAAGTAVWHGKTRVICEADTDGMAEYIVAALNFALENGFKWEPKKDVSK